MSTTAAATPIGDRLKSETAALHTQAEKSPLQLREPTAMFLVPWDEGCRGTDGVECSLETAECQAIGLAIEEFGDIVLNVQGETWRSPAAADVRKPWQPGARRPFSLITSDDGLSQIAVALAREAVIGLDVETTIYRQELRLIQIATHSQTYIVDPIAVLSLDPLRLVLGPEGPLKVIHNGSFERRILGEAGFALENVFDTLEVSRRLGPPQVKHGLAEVCHRHLGRTLDKSLQTSDWARRPLSREQLDYAATDAEVLLDLREALERRIQAGSPIK